MPFKPERKKTGGRRKGTPNKLTGTARDMLGQFIDGNFQHLPKWFDDIDDPAKKVALFLKLLEFHLPRMRSTEFTEIPDLVRFLAMPPDERTAEIQRIKALIK